MHHIVALAAYTQNPHVSDKVLGWVIVLSVIAFIVASVVDFIGTRFLGWEKRSWFLKKKGQSSGYKARQGKKTGK